MLRTFNQLTKDLGAGLNFPQAAENNGLRRICTFSKPVSGTAATNKAQYHPWVYCSRRNLSNHIPRFQWWSHLARHVHTASNWKLIFDVFIGLLGCPKYHKENLKINFQLDAV